LIVSVRFFLGLRLGRGGLGNGEGANCSVEDIGDGLGGRGFDIAATSDLGRGGTGGESWLRRPSDTWLS
jgi:hypothetical protein